MKKALYFALAALMLAGLTACGSGASENHNPNSGKLTGVTADAPNAPAMEVNDEGVPKNGFSFSGNNDDLQHATDEPGTGEDPELQPMSEEIARAVVQVWLEGNPFGARTELEPGYSEVEINGAEFYRFDFSVTRLAVFDILVEKTTGRIYVSGGTLGSLIEPIDEWYLREHSGNEGLATGYEAEIIGTWRVTDGYEWHDWFIGGEVIDFYEGGTGVESLDGSTWHFTWWAEEGLEMNYNADEPYEMNMISLNMIYEYEQTELRFYLYDNDGSILWDSKLNLDQGAGPPLVLERD